MAEVVGIYAASHTPVMLNFPDLVGDEDREAVYGGFSELGARIAAANPQAVIIISDDHLHNFYLDNLPAFCLGAATRYASPIEHWLKAEKRMIPGDAGLGAYLIDAAFKAGFDPAFSMNLTLDHGCLTPLELAAVDHSVSVVPLLVNCVQPPLPTMQRCLQWGGFLGGALRAYAGLERIAILATGGLSHDVGTPRMGMVNPDFDLGLLAFLRAGDTAAAAKFAAAQVDSAGNGAEEVRTWLIAAGAAGAARFDPIFYRPVPQWYTGIGIGEWRM